MEFGSHGRGGTMILDEGNKTEKKKMKERKKDFLVQKN
jgi:hypothetical protein